MQNSRQGTPRPLRASQQPPVALTLRMETIIQDPMTVATEHELGHLARCSSSSYEYSRPHSGQSTSAKFTTSNSVR